MNNQSNFVNSADFELQLANAQLNDDSEAFELLLMMGEEDNVYGEERVAPELEAEWEAPEAIEYASEASEPAEQEEDFALEADEVLPWTGIKLVKAIANWKKMGVFFPDADTARAFDEAIWSCADDQDMDALDELVFQAKKGVFPKQGEDFALDQSVPLPMTDNQEDFEEVQDKLKEMGIPPLTAIVAPTHGDWNAINKMAALEKATTLLINMKIQAHAEDKAMWQEKINAKNREMAALVASVNALLNPTRPIYVADALRKKNKPLGYSQTTQFQHSPECLVAWRFAKVDEYVSQRNWKRAQSQLIGVVEGIELLFPGTLADIVDTVRRIRNSKPDGLIKAVEKARGKYMPMISDGYATCAALHVQKETV